MSIRSPLHNVAGPLASRPRLARSSPLLRHGAVCAHYGLANGELSERDTLELRALKAVIQERSGFRCDGYKEKCLRRRIAVRMRASGVHSFASYAALLESDAEECARLLDAFTINVSKFFRNAEVWARVEEEVVPWLFRLTSPDVRVWSAGCAAGEEAYTLAMLVRGHAERHGGDSSRFHIIGTDIDTAVLDAARRAAYAEFAFSETPAAMRERWFEGPLRNRVRPELRRMVKFAPLDLITDAYPRRQHLILCRNVVIYFERAAQVSVFDGFSRSLDSGGWLVLGKVEALLAGAGSLFDAVSHRDRVFKKP